MTAMWVRTTLFAAFGTYAFCGAAALHAQSNGATSQSADAHIVDVTAITQVLSDGLKVSAVAIQYDRNIRDASLAPADFTVQTDVADQKILRVYTSHDGLMTSQRGLDGRYVILELSTDYVIPVAPRKAPAPPPVARPPVAQAPRPEPVKESIVLNPEVVARVGNVSWDPAAHPATLKSSRHGGNGKSVVVNQVGDIAATDGMTLSATTASRDNVYVRNLVVDGFMKPDFTGGPHGMVKYNIHFPGNYDANTKYPVVVFLSDSDSPSGYTHAEYLIHGEGGVVWADKRDEALHPAIVVVPALSRPLINESYEPTSETRPGGQVSTPYLTILDLMDGLFDQIPNVDRSRIYLTGQGDGARAAIRLMTDRPDLFAAALLFAPDYDASKAAPLSKASMWLVASAGDEVVQASMDRFTENLQKAGARVGKYEWNGQSASAQFAADVRAASTQNRNIRYTVLKKGTVVNSSQPDDVLNNHAYTWRTGYSIQPLRDWLFTQRK